ncbi:MAG: 23S rRNA (uracil(1939)-C(5))-methyltransferase RlmD [Gammaproteobacteria bacterium]
MSRRARREPVELGIDSLSHEGRGVARLNGKTVFVHNALPGERVEARIVRRRGRFDEAETLAVLEASPERIEARCPHYALCGGCSLQHMPASMQLAHKQSVLLELLEHHAHTAPQRVAAPVTGPQWGYRRKARLGVKHVEAKGGVIVGFRERSKPYVADCHRCDVLDPRIGSQLDALRELVAGLSVARRLPQIEIACGDDVVALILRHLDPLAQADLARLREFAARSGFVLYLQSGGPDTVTPLDADPRPLGYALDGRRFEFGPGDFTQVNAAINARMVERALDCLELRPGDRVADLFCGIGNFSLPLAARAAQVVGIEGDAALVARAAANAATNGLANARFEVADLMSETAVARLALGGPNKLLLDPPRAGARVVIEALSLDEVERLVYVSCNPVTFARDAAVLVDRHGFRLAETGILDMFPQTAHVESLSLFVRP